MVSSFAQRVYDRLCRVPKGKVTTYRELAHVLNSKAYRAVGLALRSNPYAPNVPCHRVVQSDGSIGGFKGTTCGQPVEEKIALLKGEGVRVENNRVADFDRVLYRF